MIGIARAWTCLFECVWRSFVSLVYFGLVRRLFAMRPNMRRISVYDGLGTLYAVLTPNVLCFVYIYIYAMRIVHSTPLALVNQYLTRNIIAIYI